MIKYVPKPKQLAFHSAHETEVFFGGAKGPGKSAALVQDATAYALQFPGSDPHLFRETYDVLRDTLIKEFKEKVSPDIYQFNESAHEARFVNGSVLKFRFVDNYAAALQYDGRSIPYLGVDEITKHEFRSIQQLMSCMRCAQGWPVYFRATGNPGGIGHAAVKARYITPTENGKKTYVDQQTGNSIRFIPANVYDGVLTEMDPAYVKRLENLPEQRRRALLHGDWDVFEGQFFANFGPHLEEKPWEIPNHLVDGCLFGSLDYGPGLNGTSSFGLYFADSENVPHRLATVVRTGLAPSDLADEIFDFCDSFHFTGCKKPNRVFCDHNLFPILRVDGKNTDGQNDTTPIAYFKKRFGAGTKWIPANKHRINGWGVVLDRFQPDTVTGKAKFKYWPEYNRSLEEHIKQLVHDENNPGDVLKCDIDHEADELRYGLVGHMGLSGVGHNEHDDRNRFSMRKLELAIAKMPDSVVGW